MDITWSWDLMLRSYTNPGLWTLCCSLSPTFRTSIMQSHIWGKSDVICYWCILEFKSSLIQTKGWNEGSEERQFPPSTLHTHTCVTTLTRTSGKHVPEIRPLRHTSQCQNMTFHYHFHKNLPLESSCSSLIQSHIFKFCSFETSF